MSRNCVLVAQLCQILCDSMIDQEAFLSMEFSRQEYWSGLSFPTPGALPNLGLNPLLLHRQVDSLTEPPGRDQNSGSTRELSAIPNNHLRGIYDVNQREHPTGLPLVSHD